MRTKMISANAGSTATEYDIKLDRGGIVDIEFIVQYLVLAHAATHGEIMTPRTTLTQLEALAVAGLLAPDDASVLQETYLVYLRASLDDKLMERPVRVPMDRLVTERESVKAIWERTFG